MEKPLILLVDDNPKNLQVLGGLLEGTYKTAVAENGAEALKFVKKRVPDLILLDIMMPEMDGFEVCQHLKAFPEAQNIPVIFLTARTETEDVVKGFEVGAVDYITKPFQKREIMARINTHLTIHNLQKRVKEQNLQLQQEIIERKRTEESLKELEFIVNHSPAIVFLWQATGHWPVEFVSENIQQFGYIPEDFYTQRILFADIVHSDDLDWVVAEVARYSEEGRTEFTQEYRIISKTGEVRWIDDRSWVRRDAAGDITHYQGIVVDITERKQFEEQLKQAKEELEELNASKDKFFSIIAHDLRGPLGALHSLSEVIVENIEGYSKDKLIKFLTTQRDAAKNLLALLENLLTWSRIQRGMIEFRPQDVNIEWVISRNIDLFTPTAEQKQITLKSSIPEKVVAYADQSMINTVVRNLISNALKFTDSGGTITVSVRQDDTSIKVSVSDTGIGIDAKHVTQLFQIDAKYQRKGTANEQGTELGLILCKEFVERNGGEIRVKSDVGKGTTFTFTLPFPQNSLPTSRQSESHFEDISRQEPELSLSFPPDSGVLPSSTPLVPPPQENLKTLLDAAMIGDILSIQQQAEQIETTDPRFAPFANRLSRLADNFMISKIQEFLTQYIEEK